MKKLLLAGLALFVALVLLILLSIVSALSHLPDVSALRHYRPAAAAEVLDKDGNVLTQYFDRKFRIWAPLHTLPDIIVNAVVTAEDDTFFEHGGVNYQATWDALVLDVRKRKFARGGSTITQQMIKNVLLSKEKTITRKLREYVLARRAEEILTKRKILEIYLNEVEWGENIYGIEAASRYYLDKHASALTIGEAALLAGMLPNPRYYNPFKRPDKARDRRERVLFNLQQAKLITQEEYAAARAGQVKLRQEGTGQFDLAPLSGGNSRPCYQQALEKMLANLYGEQALYHGGLTIRTTLDKSLQEEVCRGKLCDESNSGREGAPVAVIKQDGLVRAIACEEGKEAEITSRSEGILGAGVPFTITTLSPESVNANEIVLSAPLAGTTASK